MLSERHKQDLDTIGMALRLRGMASETRWQEQLGRCRDTMGLPYMPIN